jgi:hypothetical protein
MPTTESLNGELAIWGRLLQAVVENLTVAGARCLVRLEFTPEEKMRMHELAAKARAGTLSEVEQEETRSFERVGNLLALIKSKARQRLKNAARANGVKA